MAKQKIIILGATGSIGRSTLDVLADMADEWEVVGLAAGSKGRDLAELANRFRPPALALARDEEISAMDAALDYSPRIFGGKDGLAALVSEVPCDCVVAAVVGAEGLAATLRAAELGRRIALANKEALVIAGAILMPLARRSGATIIPVDSEHSAIFQALHAGHAGEIHRVYLTASGGPFRTWMADQLDAATVEDALRHPTWRMGPKITIDSATMMNKALEIVEARWLFDLNHERIAVVVHPESIIHSIVEFCDGSMIAQMGMPDMRVPIQYALTYPQRRPRPGSRLDLHKVGQLGLFPPDPQRFPALRLGHEVAKKGGTCGAVLNAANEAAVKLFREGVIRFGDIARHTERALTQHEFKPLPTLQDLLDADRQAREEVQRCIPC